MHEGKPLFFLLTANRYRVVFHSLFSPSKNETLEWSPSIDINFRDVKVSRRWRPSRKKRNPASIDRTEAAEESESLNASHVGQGFRTIELRTVESGGAKGSIEKRSSTREIIQLRRRQDVDRLRNGSRHLPILRKPRRSRHRSARGKRRRFVRKTTKKRNRIDFPFRSPHDSDEDLSGDGLQRAAGT